MNQINNNYKICSFESSNNTSEYIAKLDELNDKVISFFKKSCSFSSFYLYSEKKNQFVASVLFKKEKDINSSKKYHEQLICFVYKELEQQGFGAKEEINVQFYFESDEKLFSKKNTPKTPTEAEFAKAEKLEEKRSHNLDKVNKNVFKHFKTVTPLHYFYIMHQGDDSFRAYVFFNKDQDIKEAQEGGLFQDIENFIYKELERFEKGKRKNITLVIEFDSHENIEQNYEGDYFLRLR